jgi:choline dehydrogenase-like flavoprotein
LTRFGQLYREEIGGASNISVLLCGNLVEIETTPNAREVLRLHAAYIGGGRFTIRARAYILAAGGIENARLLLASDRHRPAGIGNEHDVVGRYFGEHLTVSGAFFLASRDDLVTDLYNSLRQFGVKRCAYLVPSPETQQTERLLNMRTWLDDVAQLTALRWSGPGIQAADDLVEALRRGEVPDDLPEHLWRAITDLDNISMYAYFTFLEPKKKIPAFLLTSHIEQAPNPESRVTLSDERDELGMRRVKLDWRFGELEKHTFRRGMEILGEEVGRAGLGRVRVIPEGAHLEGPEFQDGKGRLDRSQVPDYSGWPPPGVRGSYHHLGTTRMASDPRNGVVDADCRVHGIANLYVAGSSVFPTVGYTNPTLTIVALSLRLADHVKALLT